MKLVCTPEDPPKAAFVGGLDDIFMNDLVSITLLFKIGECPRKKQSGSKRSECNDYKPCANCKSDKAKMKNYKTFKSFEALDKYAVTASDANLIGKVKIVAHFKLEMFDLVPKIKERCR